MTRPAKTLPPLKPANPENDGRDKGRPPTMPYFHMWTGPTARAGSTAAR